MSLFSFFPSKRRKVERAQMKLITVTYAWRDRVTHQHVSVGAYGTRVPVESSLEAVTATVLDDLWMLFGIDRELSDVSLVIRGV